MNSQLYFQLATIKISKEQFNRFQQEQYRRQDGPMRQRWTKSPDGILCWLEKLRLHLLDAKVTRQTLSASARTTAPKFHKTPFQKSFAALKGEEERDEAKVVELPDEEPQLVDQDASDNELHTACLLYTSPSPRDS